MAPGSLFPYLQMRRFPTGRRIFTLEQTRVVADKHLPTLLPLIDQAIAHDRNTLRLEGLWSRTRGDTSTSRGEATVIDAQIDRTLVAMETVAKGQQVGPKGDLVADAATRFLKAVFPLGVQAVTQKPFEEQLGGLKMLVELFDGELEKDVKLIGVERHLAQLKPLMEQFEQQLALTKTPHITWDVVSAAQREGQELLAEVVVVILGAFHARNSATTSVREELLAEYNRQDALLREAFRRQRRPLDVNPDTGEEVDTELPETAEDAA